MAAIPLIRKNESNTPLRLQEQAMNTTFCMAAGQVKAGDGPLDTYTKMLQEMVRVTPAVSYGIAAEYPTVQKLAQAFKAMGPTAVADCKKSSNKNGAFTDGVVGPAISKRLYSVFTGRDERSDDV